MIIVLAIDGNPPAEAAERLLALLLGRDRARVHVVAVCGFETVLSVAEKSGRYDPAAGRRQAEAGLAATLARLTDAGVNVGGEVLEGDPAQEILLAADRRGAELITVGAGHTRWLETLVLGSTSTKVLHTAAVSVLVAHRAPAGPLRVLVGTDGSASSLQAARVFAALTDPARCSVRVATVTAAGSTDGEPAIAAVGQILRAAGFTFESEVVAGNPATVLLERATAHDLVVVGSRGTGALRRALLGSVSDGLVRGAPATLVGR